MAYLYPEPRIGIGERIRQWLAPSRAGEAEPASRPIAAPPTCSWQQSLFGDIGTFLGQHGLDPTPENYTLAYEFFVANNARLVAAVRAEIERSGKLDSRTADQIFDDAGAGASANKLAELAERMATQAKGLTSIAKQSGRDTEAFASALETVPGQAEGSIPVVELARQMAVRTRRAEAQLKSAQRELKSMRTSLADAQHAADVDALTDLPNRRAFKRALEAMLDQANATASPLALAFCDIDHFKAVNDRFGHAAGDRVLRYVATVLRRDLSGTGMVGRFGGEEFVVAMPGLAIGDAHRAIDTCRDALASRNLIAADEGATIGTVTFSAGLTAWAAGDDSAALLRRADEALYKAKDAGRNRIVLA